MNNLKQKLIILILPVFAFSFWVKTPKAKPAFIPNGIFTSIDWEYVERKWAWSGQINTCVPTDLKKGIIGVKAKLIEPFLVAETVKRPFYMKMLEMSLDKDSLKSMIKSGKISKGGSKYLHIFRFPILAILMKMGNVDTKGVFYFAAPYTTAYYMSELDPTSWRDFLKIKMLAEYLPFITPQGIAGAITDCVAAMEMEARNSIKGKDNSNFNNKDKFAKDIRDTYFFANGCNGIMSIGSNNDEQENSFVTSINMVQSNLYEFARTGLYKQTVVSILNRNQKDIWCEAEKGIRIKWQFVPQIVRPLTGLPTESGVSSIVWSSLKRDGSSGGDVVFEIYKKRDYTAFAYQGGD
jgi:hypothetical protein